MDCIGALKGALMLNEMQNRAVLFKDGPALVLAGPGSGKTTVITQRIKHLIEEGVKPQGILVITFTRAAAMEMKERFMRLCPQGGDVNFGTFHSIFFQVLRKQYHFTAADILNQNEKIVILKDVLRKQKISLENQEDLENIFQGISQVKAGKITPEEYEGGGVSAGNFKKIYTEFAKSIFNNKKLDFDDMVGLTAKLFEERPDILSFWQRQYEYILVDEFQDISPLQYKVTCMLARPQNNLFIVGDDDQSIYGFRGSDPKIMLGFKNDFPDCEEILLDTNYRCSSEILSCALAVIGKNKIRFNKELKAFRTEENAPVEYYEADDERMEAEFVKNNILKAAEEGLAYENIAVLYRTHSQKEVLQRLLLREKVPVCTSDKLKNIYEGEIATDVIAYIKTALGTGKRSDLIRIINRPQRQLLREALTEGEGTLEDMKKYYRGDDFAVEKIENWEKLNEILIKMPPRAAINLIRFGMGYQNFLVNRAKSLGKKPEDDIKILEEIQEDAGDFKTLKLFLKFAEEEKKRENTRENPKSGVGLYSLHASKGLEFDTVFILDVNETVTPKIKRGCESDIEEERRLFYVGMTRAKNRLVLTGVKKRGNQELVPSRFLSEANLIHQ